MAAFLIYFLISLLVITLGHDLTKGILKNQLSSGVSRRQFFFSKYLVFNVICLIQFVIYYGVGFITSSLSHGFGKLSPSFLGLFFGSMALQFLFVQAIIALGILILHLTFQTVWSVLAIIVFPVMIGLIGAISRSQGLKYLDYQGALAMAQQLPHGQIPGFIASALTFIFILIGGAYLFFQRKDL